MIQYDYIIAVMHLELNKRVHEKVVVKIIIKPNAQEMDK